MTFKFFSIFLHFKDFSFICLFICLYLSICFYFFQEQEQLYQAQLQGIQNKGSDIIPIGKSATEQNSEDEEDDNDDDYDDDDNDDDDEEDDDSEMNDDYSDPMLH